MGALTRDVSPALVRCELTFMEREPILRPLASANGVEAERGRRVSIGFQRDKPWISEWSNGKVR